MTNREQIVSTVDALVAATKEESVDHITVRGKLANAPSVRLSPGQTMRGDGDDAVVTFAATDGVQLSSDNRIHNLRVETSPEKRAIFNDTSVDSLGRIELRGVTAVGRVQILARDKVRAGHVDVTGLDIVAADARAETDRPQGYGVYVLQGAFTLWNMQQDTSVSISSDLVGLSASVMKKAAFSI